MQTCQPRGAHCATAQHGQLAAPLAQKQARCCMPTCSSGLTLASNAASSGGAIAVLSSIGPLVMTGRDSRRPAEFRRATQGSGAPAAAAASSAASAATIASACVAHKACSSAAATLNGKG